MMIRRNNGQLLAILLTAMIFTLSTASAQHSHDKKEHEHQAASAEGAQNMSMDGHKMVDGMPHFMREGAHVDAVKQTLTRYAAAAAQSNIDGMSDHVVQTDEFTIVEGSHPNWGWVDYRDNHLKPEFDSADFELKSYAYDEFRVSATPMFAYVTFKIALEATVKGEEISRERMGTAILIKTADGWRIRHLHTS